MKKLERKEVSVSNLSEIRSQAIDFMHSAWARDCLGNDVLDIDTKNFNSIGDTIFRELTKNLKPSKKPFMFRLGGQSGSGKTTQLMPVIDEVIRGKRLDFITVAVRILAPHHPYYNQLIEEFGAGMIREKTNGFALMMLFRIVEMLIEKNYNILLDVTLLDPSFEEYLMNLAKRYGYNLHFHILSIPKYKSDCWIEKRKKLSLTECNRIVLKSSADFFYDILPIAIKNMIGWNIWSNEDRIFLWSGFNLKPVIDGSIYNNSEFLKRFNYYRELEFDDVNIDMIFEAKTNWFNNYYKNLL